MEMTYNPTIIVDLDGTLCNDSKRQHLAQARLWDEYHARLSEDVPFLDVLEMLHFLRAQPGLDMVVVTARPEAYRGQTLKWLAENDVTPDELLMRPDNDYSLAEVLKLRLIEQYFGTLEKAKFFIVTCLEDRDKVCEAFRNAGLPCWQVRVGGC